MVEEEAEICRIANDVEGAIYIAVSGVGEEEELGWHPSDEFIEALKKELRAHGETGALKLVEKGTAILKELEEEEE